MGQKVSMTGLFLFFRYQPYFLPQTCHGQKSPRRTPVDILLALVSASGLVVKTSVLAKRLTGFAITEKNQVSLCEKNRNTGN